MALDKRDEMGGTANTSNKRTNRRGFLKRSAVSAGLFGGISLSSVPVHAKSVSSQGNENADLVFPVISDTHIKRDSENDDNLETFRESLTQLNKVTPDRDALVVLGDLTDYGLTEEYNRFNQVFAKAEQKRSTPLFAIGNHDYWNGLSPKEAQQRFLKNTGMESIYYHKIINGYHFIVLGTEDGHTPGTFSVDQIEWLDDQLAIAHDDDPGKPIFVFHHQPIRGTVYGSEWGFEKNRDLIYDTLNKYPQVISFSGHTHYPMDDPRIVHQKDFTAVGTATTAYMWIDDGRLQGEVPPNAGVLNQGLIVETHGKNVFIKRRDFHDGSWTDRPFKIGPFTPGRGFGTQGEGRGSPQSKSNRKDTKTPNKNHRKSPKFKYTEDRDKKAPRFSDDATLSVVTEKTTATHLEIEIPQARDNLLVHDYKVHAKEQDSGNVGAEYLAFSEFYKDPVPDPLVLPIDGLKPETSYTVEVRAIDAFGNESEEVLTTVGETKP